MKEVRSTRGISWWDEKMLPSARGCLRAEEQGNDLLGVACICGSSASSTVVSCARGRASFWVRARTRAIVQRSQSRAFAKGRKQKGG
ncbi:unnamed protein product [Protopolystoma xenopodis]|uniref:Uncharacterized protein n=1 Tax=Protopolystoma xenopodis TaxID=117903 RepID=A0A448XQ26_9PLAT|nr:unnamed protein product [Protopolystoma xenopodis]